MIISRKVSLHNLFQMNYKMNANSLKKTMISAIVLAAGESRRMVDHNKLLMTFNEKSLIEHIVDTLLQSEVDEIIVVVGYEAQKIRDRLQTRKIKIIDNPNFQSGMTTSIHAGVKAAGDTDAFMICLSDLPFIESIEYNRLVQSFKKAYDSNDKPIIVPTYDGQRGNPVIFSVYYKSEILTHKGKKGCRGVVKHNSQHVNEVSMSKHILKDIDTIEDYNKLLTETSISQISK